MDQWWYAADGERHGPLDIDALRVLYGQGAIGPATLAWRTGMAEWTGIGEIVELASLAPALPPALPTPLQKLPAGQAAYVPDSARSTNSPWRRFFARSIDMVLHGVLVTAIVIVLFRHIPEQLGSSLLGWLLTPATLLLEALIFSMAGTTPGKSLLGVTVRTLDGGKPRLDAYLKRMAGLWWYGLGASIPIISFFTMARQYLHLKAGETIVYDADRFAVRATPFTAARWTVAVCGALVVVIVAMILLILVSMP